MIKFFRKIRQNLLSEGKTGKYLKYAIGEIILVVIGILIALQINNWNQNQKDRELGINYLNRITIDIKKDTIILNQKNNLADKLTKGYLDFIREMYKKQESKEEFIKLMSSVEFNVDDLILTDIAYSELVNTGNLDLIYDDNLRNQITDYYRYYEFVASRVNELNKSNLTQISTLARAWPNMKYVLQGYMGILPENIFVKDNYMYNNDEWALINNPSSMEFRLQENVMYFYYMKQVILKPMFIVLNSKANNLLDSIRKELTE
tara:strand:- start:6471 stop:7256 length:786 start_codon:yes stop_codon:yes gene_type:complete